MTTIRTTLLGIAFVILSALLGCGKSPESAKPVAIQAPIVTIPATLKEICEMPAVPETVDSWDEYSAFDKKAWDVYKKCEDEDFQVYDSEKKALLRVLKQEDSVAYFELIEARYLNDGEAEVRVTTRSASVKEFKARDTAAYDRHKQTKGAVYKEYTTVKGVAYDRYRSRGTKK